MVTYTDAATIAAALGVTFTPEQASQADAVAAAVTAFIDRYTGRSWQGTSPVTGELVPIIAPTPSGGYYPAATAYLPRRPAVAVSAVSVRAEYTFAPATVLSAGQFELLDPVNGVLRLAVWSEAWPSRMLAVVDYTYADAVPPDIALAATMIASQQMARVLAVQQATGVTNAHPELAGIDSIAVGQNDVNVKLSSDGKTGGGFSSAGSGWAAPGSAVAAILDGYRRPVIA